MPNPGKGELRTRRDGGHTVRLNIGKRKRISFRLARLTEEQAEKRKEDMVVILRRLKEAGQLDQGIELLNEAAIAADGKPWDMHVAAIDTLCSGKIRPLKEAPPTVAEFAKDWTEGKLHERFPHHVPLKVTADDDERLFRLYINPHIGDIPINVISLDHADLVMAKLPGHLSANSRKHVAQVLQRLLKLAVYPGKHMTLTPIPEGWSPKSGQPKAYPFLYPEEDARLLACTDVPLLRRLFYGISIREGFRRSDLSRLRWRHVDLDKGLVRLDKNKTKRPRAWTIDPGVANALRAWRKRVDGQDDEHVIAEQGRPLYVLHAADDLRDDLRKAGITRAELFEKTDERGRIREHDLRASFVTVSLATGRTEAWVMARTGHRNSDMINRYRRAAETWAEANIGPYAPLDQTILELNDGPTMAQSNDLDGSDEDPEPSANYSGEKGIRTPGTLAGTPDFETHAAIRAQCNANDCANLNNAHESPLGALRMPAGPSGDIDSDDQGLIRAIEHASAAGRFDVVAQLARILESRQIARAENVIVLPGHGRR